MNFETASDGEFPLYGPLIMLIVDSILYFLLAMYFDNVIPGKEIFPAYRIGKSDVLSWVRNHFLAHQIEKSDVLPCVRNLLSHTCYLTQVISHRHITCCSSILFYLRELL